jgi:hypothetical protein
MQLYIHKLQKTFLHPHCLISWELSSSKTDLHENMYDCSRLQERPKSHSQTLLVPDWGHNGVSRYISLYCVSSQGSLYFREQRNKYCKVTQWAGHCPLPPKASIHTYHLHWLRYTSHNQNYALSQRYILKDSCIPLQATLLMSRWRKKSKEQVYKALC